MADPAGDDVAVMLLRVLPAEVAELILTRMDGETATRLRGRLAAAPPEPPPGPELDAALAQFFDLQRIAGRAPAAAPPAGEYTPVAKTEIPADPLEAVRVIPPDHLARALAGEQPGTVVLVLSCLEPAAAGQVMKRLPADTRAEVALRMTRGGARNPVLLREVVRAAVEKAKRVGEAPPEPTQEELITNLADMLRALPRAERLPVIRKIEATDAELAAKVMDKLYRIEDLLRIPDRQIQLLLSKLDVKTIAVALKGVDQRVTDKVMNNMSSRSRATLAEEGEMLGTVPGTRVREAQAKVMALVKKGEEEGEITMEE
jgi:flagellar motor switch protein FliG